MVISIKMLCFFLIVSIITIGVVTGTQIVFNPQIIYAQNNIGEISNKSLEKIWETPSQLKNPESISFDSNKSLLYVSNVNGNPEKIDHNGFISKVSSTNGTIIELNWVSNLNAPKGIDIDNNTGKIYVSDITELIEIDSSSGEITNHYPALANSSLNDVVIDKKGNVFVSDPPNNAIFTLGTENANSSKSLQIWLKSNELNGPNGILFDYGKNHLVVASMGKDAGTIKAIDLNNKTIVNIGEENKTAPVGVLDGLQMSTDEKFYYVSDWKTGNIYIVDVSGKGYHPLFNPPIQGMADFKFIGLEGKLIIPLMQDNKIIAFRMNEN
jgi:sugar lactone lactonase YvrE